MTDWYTGDIWKAYAGWLSPRWAEPREDFDPIAWCDALERGGFRIAVVHVKHHDGLCFYPSRYRDSPPPRDYFGDLVAEAHRRGIRVVAYYSTTFDSQSAEEHPEWCCREADGSITELKWPPFPMGVCCHNNPGYRAFLLGQLEEVQERYDTDGFWMDGFDYTGYPSHACFCCFCRERYARERGGDLLSVPFVNGHPPEDLKLWQRDVFVELMEDIRAIALRGRADRIVLYNNAGASLELGYDRIDALCTLNSMEAHTPAVKSFMGRLLAAQRRPYEIYTPISDKVFSWTPRTTAMLTLEAAIVAAHGGTVLAGLDITPSGYILGSQMEQVRKVGGYLRARREWFLDAEPVYDVGLLLPKDQWKNERGNWGMTLLRNQVPFALLPLHTTDFSAYRVVIVSDGFQMTDALAQALVAYVAAGGNLIVERDAAGPLAEDGADAFRLAELLGIKPLGGTGFETNYLGTIDPRIASGLWDEPVRSDGPAWRIRATTGEVLARYVYPVARYSRERWVWREPNPPRHDVSDDPVVTINRFGKGRAAYIACPLGTDDKRQRREIIRLAVNLLDMLDDEPLVRAQVPSGVEVVLARALAGTSYVLHLLNHYVDESSRYDRDDSTVPTLADMSVWLNERRIGPVRRVLRILPGDDPTPAEAPFERDGAWVRVRADRLAVHEMFVVEG